MLTALPASERVLVLITNAADARRTVQVLATAGLEGVACADGPHLCRELVAGAGAVLLSEEAILADRERCIQQTLLNQPAWSSIPLVAVVQEGAAVDRRDSLLSDFSANITLIERPVRMRTLVSVVRGALRARRHQYEVRDAIAERELALDAARLGWWRYDPATNVTSYDERFAEIFGVSGSERPNEDILRLIHPDDSARVAGAIAAALDPRNRRPFSAEYRVNRPDGRMCWVEAHGLASFEGEIATRHPTRFVGTVADVTERKGADAQLRESEERYRTLFNSIDEGFCVIEMLFDQHGKPVDYRFLEVNPAFEAQSGMRDVTGRRMLEFVPTIEEHWLTNYGRVAQTGEPIRFVNEYKTLNRWFDVYAFHVGPSDAHRVAVLFTDVTDRKRSEEALRDADRRKDQFLATLAHELRNPLAPISNALQAWPLIAEDRAKTEQMQGLINRQVQQMIRLIDDLLDVSRVSRGKLELRKQRLDLGAVAESALEGVRPFVDACHHELSVSFPDEPVILEGDPGRLMQVIGNLVHNAAKYTGRNGHISLNVRREGSEAVISVRDDGAGIPREMLGRIFEMFTQVDQTLDRAHGGLGIGLTLVKTLVDLHGGTVEARSDGPGQGSEFIVRLPADRCSSMDAPSDLKPTSAFLRAAPPKSRRVLVVDDVRPSANTLALMLNGLGQETRTAFDGASALAVAAEFRPDVIFLDIAMPGMDGYEVAKRIRATELRPVLVALTGYGQEEDRRQAFDAGFDHHLVKPTSVDALHKLLEDDTAVAASREQ